MSWLLNSIEARSQRLLFLQSTDECEDAIRYHRNYNHELIVQASAKTLGSCKRRAQIRFALYPKPQCSRKARRQRTATAMSHTTSAATKHRICMLRCVMTNDCACNLQLGSKALQSTRRQQATSARPSLVMSRSVLSLVSFGNLKGMMREGL